MMPAALVATSSRSGCVWPESPGLQVLVDDVVVLVELSRYDDAFRGVMALIYAVVRAVGVFCFLVFSSALSNVRPTRSIDPVACGVGWYVWRPGGGVDEKNRWRNSR